MKKYSSAVLKYRRALYRALPCQRRLKKNWMAQMDARLSEYAAENPVCAYSDLIGHFGTPADFAGSYLASLGTAEILTSVCRRRRTVNAVLAAALLLLCGLVCLYADRFRATTEALDGYAVITTYIMDEKGNWIPLGEEHNSAERPDERYRVE